MLRVLTILGIIGGLSVLAGHMPASGQVADVTWPWDVVRSQTSASYPISASGVLQISDLSGDVYVTGSSGSTVDVTVKKSAKNRDDLNALSANVASAPAGISITTDYPSHCENCDVSYEIRVPRGVKVVVDDDSGDVHVTGTDGLIDVSASSGDVRLEDDSGAVNVDESSGDVRMIDVTGSARVKSSSGEINATGLTKNVDFYAASGDVTAKFASFNDVDTVRMRTASGSITLDVPRSFGARITATTDSGSLDSNMKLPIQDHDSGSDLSVAVGSGKTTVKLVAASGDISINGE
jgi:DUF4097 and DUF4098 domain-containing protein YvlB